MECFIETKSSFCSPSQEFAAYNSMKHVYSIVGFKSGSLAIEIT